MKKRIVCLLLTLMIALTMAFVPALAESEAPAFCLTDLTAAVSGQTFTLPMTASEFRADGLPLPELNKLAEGTYYPGVKVKLTDEISFSARVSYCNPNPDEMLVDGLTLSIEDCPGASIGGFVIGETTRGQVTDALGADVNGNIDSSELTYYAYHINITWFLTFEDASANAKLKRAIVSSDMINEYGFEFSDLAGMQADNLPDPASMNYNEFILDGKHYAAGSSLQTLLDNGWTLPLDMDPASEIEGLSGIWVHGEHLDLYNGQTMAHVSVYNYSDKTAPLNECLIETVSVETEDNTILLSAGGLQAGVSTVADAEALLGAPADTEEDYKGLVTYEFKVMDDQVTISAIDDGDGLIDELIISGVNR